MENKRLKLSPDKIDEKEYSVEQSLLRLEQNLEEKSDEPSIVKELDTPALNINSLPEEIFLQIFGYLTHDEMCRIGRVCRRWYLITKCPILWKKVNVNFLQHCGLYEEAAKFVKVLPTCVTYMKLEFTVREHSTERLNFQEFSMRLQKRCPNLKTLIFDCAELSDSLPSIIYLCAQFLESVRVLAFHHCQFAYYLTEEKDTVISKIEILDIRSCYPARFNKSIFSKMPHLKKLYLYETYVNDYYFGGDNFFPDHLEVLDMGYTLTGTPTFRIILNHGRYLTELYMCGTDVTDDDFKFNKSRNAFPHLKKICLRSCHYVTCEGIFSLMKSCQCLQNIYVGESIAKLFTSYSFPVNNYKLELIKVVQSCLHDKIMHK